jgi:hypothetical protein
MAQANLAVRHTAGHAIGFAEPLDEQTEPFKNSSMVFPFTREEQSFTVSLHPPQSS